LFSRKVLTTRHAMMTPTAATMSMKPLSATFGHAEIASA